MTQISTTRSREQGFTLVELAIVMIIIGLLIGGILKGQELISNARVAAAVSKVKAVDAALSTFRDSYQGVPGDLRTPGSRIPNCSGVCAQEIAGEVGNGRIGSDTTQPGMAQGTASENVAAWAQLAAADMISGVQSSAATTAAIEAGTTVPNGELAGQLYLGYVGNSSLTNFAGNAVTELKPRAGHYIALYNGANGTATATAASTATALSLTPSQASRLDSKMDDGLPNTGSVLAMGTASATTCSSAATTVGVYNTTLQGSLCGAYFRIQQ